MKYSYYRYAMLLAAGFLLSCSDDKLETQETERQNIPIYASMQEPTVTRAGVAVQNVRFIAGEKVDVYMTATGQSYPQPLVYTTTASGSDGFYSLSDPRSVTPSGASAETPWPSDGYGVTIYAYYPQGIMQPPRTTARTFTVQADQSTDANYMASDLMEGEPATQNVLRAAGSVRLTFTHLLSKVLITLKGDRSLNINHAGWRTGASTDDQTAAQAESNQKLIGATVKLLSMNNQVTITSPKAISNITGSQTITVGTIAATTERVDPDDATSPWQICCIVPQQTISTGRKLIEVTMADGGVLYYTGTATLAQSTVNTFNLTVHSKEITLNGYTIAPWTAGDTDQGHETQPVITF